VQGKVAIVTGAGSEAGDIGIGKAIALLLAREGAQVAVIDLHLQRAQQTCADIEAIGGEALALAADVTEVADCERAIQATLTRFGRLDILVNNVGITPDPDDAFDEGSWKRQFDTNVGSAVLMCNRSLPALCRQGGAIINIASIAGIRAMSGTAYGPSKAALIMFTRELALRHGRHGVRANAVAPGHIDSPRMASMFPPKLRALRRNVAPLNIAADTWDIALAVLFLGSDDARFISGACLPVDGGVSEIGALAAQGLIAG
jgi:NAD(P)-dependent dehydrogenase (short-subunit alcohol dehydrogenase family)